MANEFKAKNGVISPKIVLQGSQNGTTSIVANPTASGNYTLPGALPTQNGLVLSADTSGNLSWIQAVTGSEPGGTNTYATYVYTGNGSTTTFAATSGITLDNVLVMLNGVTQTPTTNYTISGSNIVFVAPPPNNMQIQVRVLGGFQGVQGIQGASIQGVQGTTGLAFTVAKVYNSVAALTADITPTGIFPGQFAIIDTGNSNDTDNSKLYLWSGSSYQFINDLSGSAGIQGIGGATGSQGTTGTTGSQGTTGTTGSQGTAGYIGADGAQGITGSQGFTGLTGSQGITGSQGFTGTTGSQGITGTTGSQGIAGSLGDLQAVTNSIIPDVNIAYDLGSPTKRWRDLYLSGNTIDLAGVKISAAAGSVEIKDENNNTAPIKTSGIQIVSGSNVVSLVATASGLATTSAQGAPISLQGTQGLTGVQGIQGTQGIQGSIGLQGVQGLGAGIPVSEYNTYLFTGDGTTTTYTTISGISVHSVIVVINGVTQTPTNDYTVSGSNVVFTTAPANQDSIQIRVLGGLLGVQGYSGIQGTTGATGSQGITGSGGGGGSAYTWFLM